MTVIIQIHYTTSMASESYQQAEVTLKGQSPEKAAYDFWLWIKKQNQIDVCVEKILCENEDITQLVIDLEKQELNKAMNDNLPF